MNKAQAAYHLWRHLGFKWLIYRLYYGLQQRLGYFRRKFPVEAWQNHPLQGLLTDPTIADPQKYFKWKQKNLAKFFFEPGLEENRPGLFAQWDTDTGSDNPVDVSAALAQGSFRFFGHHFLPAGFPPDWQRNHFTGERAVSDLHWSEVDEFRYGDVKAIWELNRFSFVYPLVRAYGRTQDDRYAELFWQLVEDWRLHNLPQRGINWKCGQEASFRAMAWCFGLYGFFKSAVTTPERLASLVEMLAFTARRIEANFSYALSQQNNHGISEALGLWTIGILFPELIGSDRWREKGRLALERFGRELIYADGAFAQHSSVYHRLMLHDYLWVMRLGDLNRQPFSSSLKQRFACAANFLYQLVDRPTGRVPDFGHDDGSLILPLNNCDYSDFRPILQDSLYYSHQVRCFPPGAWDEDLFWLFGSQACSSSEQEFAQKDLVAETSGFYSFRSGESFALMRCTAYEHRPAHADQLHVDLWWRGQNIAIDPGTYSYNPPSSWKLSLAGTSAHNTVIVDDRDQMERLGRFLWLPWSEGKLCKLCSSDSQQLAYWEGEQHGYQRLAAPVLHRRAVVRMGAESWLIMDDLTSHRDHQYNLHWLLHAWPHQSDSENNSLVLETSQGRYWVRVGVVGAANHYSLCEAEQDSFRGWYAPYYFDRKPALSLDLQVSGSSVRFWSLFSPEECQASYTPGRLKLAGLDWSFTAYESVRDASSLFDRVCLESLEAECCLNTGN